MVKNTSEFGAEKVDKEKSKPARYKIKYEKISYCMTIQSVLLKYKPTVLEL